MGRLSVRGSRTRPRVVLLGVLGVVLSSAVTACSEPEPPDWATERGVDPCLVADDDVVAEALGITDDTGVEAFDGDTDGRPGCLFAREDRPGFVEVAVGPLEQSPLTGESPERVEVAGFTAQLVSSGRRCVIAAETEHGWASVERTVTGPRDADPCGDAELLATQVLEELDGWSRPE